MGQSLSRETAVEPMPIPITDADAADVAEFLCANHNDHVPWARLCADVPWGLKPPNHGFMLREGQRVVGTLLALYSERLVAGRIERFCNLGSWCVLPAYRSRSIALLNALLAQEGYHFTILSPSEGPREILEWLKFRSLDTSAALLPNLPWPTLPRRTTVSADPRVIEGALNGSALKIYRDHASALAARHLVVLRGHDTCHVIYRVSTSHGVARCAVILYVSDTELFHRALAALTRHLLVHDRLVATLAELRIIDRKPRFALRRDGWPKMYRSPGVDQEKIDYLYSELTCVPW